MGLAAGRREASDYTAGRGHCPTVLLRGSGGTIDLRPPSAPISPHQPPSAPGHDRLRPHRPTTGWLASGRPECPRRPAGLVLAQPAHRFFPRRLLPHRARRRRCPHRLCRDDRGVPRLHRRRGQRSGDTAAAVAVSRSRSRRPVVPLRRAVVGGGCRRPGPPGGPRGDARENTGDRAARSAPRTRLAGWLTACGQGPSRAFGHAKTCGFHRSFAPGTGSLRCSRLFGHSLLTPSSPRGEAGGRSPCGWGHDKKTAGGAEAPPAAVDHVPRGTAGMSHGVPRESRYREAQSSNRGRCPRRRRRRSLSMCQPAIAAPIPAKTTVEGSGTTTI